MQRSGIPSCLFSPVPAILDIIANRVVVRESHGPSHPNAHGVHIYFPRLRMIDNLAALDGHDEPTFSPPAGRLTDRPPWLTTGCSRTNCRKVSRPGNGEGFRCVHRLASAAVAWLQVPERYRMAEVLDRYYHPVADNHILPVMINGVLTRQPSRAAARARIRPIPSPCRSARLWSFREPDRPTPTKKPVSIQPTIFGTKTPK